jgi:DNA (cytosine-5)-methyltransferase 1
LNEPTHLDLFSGIGGFALAAQWAGFRTIGFCEIDKYCWKVLSKNFLADAEGRTGELQQGQRQDLRNKSAINGAARIIGNIFDLNGRDFAGVSIITGGFPCQPFSVAGKRRGAADDRAIWPQMFRVISEARPTWVLGENVPGIIPMELDNVLSDLEGIGYATRSFVIGACCVDAKHRRRRVWIIGRRIPNTDQQGLEGQRQISGGTGTQLDDTGDHCRWLPEPDMGRVAHGIPKRVDRLKGLGNAIVPQVAYEILRGIRKLI